MVKLAFGKGPKHRCGLLLILLAWAALLSGCVQRGIERSTFRTVVIDPGHGGHDAGANPRGVSPEKFWTLQVGLRLQKRLAQGGFYPVLTRTSDIFIPLDTRVGICNRQTNTIFVSIHFNATRKRDIRGIETYYSTARSADLAKLVHSSILRIPGAADRRVHTAAFHVIAKMRFQRFWWKEDS